MSLPNHDPSPLFFGMLRGGKIARPKPPEPDPPRFLDDWSGEAAFMDADRDAEFEGLERSWEAGEGR